jgi:hypothetical protein
MNRKDNTVKQLQAECKKRGIGFMTTWTKLALTKRLEDEDKKDKEIEILKSKSKEDQQLVKKVQKDLKELDKSEIEKKVKSDMILMKERRIKALQVKFDILHNRELEIAEENNKVAEEKLKIYKEMESIKELMTSLK